MNDLKEALLNPSDFDDVTAGKALVVPIDYAFLEALDDDHNLKRSVYMKRRTDRCVLFFQDGDNTFKVETPREKVAEQRNGCNRKSDYNSRDFL